MRILSVELTIEQREACDITPVKNSLERRRIIHQPQLFGGAFGLARLESEYFRHFK